MKRRDVCLCGQLKGRRNQPKSLAAVSAKGKKPKPIELKRSSVESALIFFSISALDLVYVPMKSRVRSPLRELPTACAATSGSSYCACTKHAEC